MVLFYGLVFSVGPASGNFSADALGSSNSFQSAAWEICAWNVVIACA